MALLNHSEKTRQGMLKAAKAGRHIGRPPKWTILDKDGTLRIREDMLPFINAYLSCAEGMVSKHDMEVLINHMLPKVNEKISIEDLRRIRRCSFYYGYIRCDDEYYSPKHSQTSCQVYWDMRLGIQELVNTRPIKISKDRNPHVMKKAHLKKFLSPLDKIQ